MIQITATDFKSNFGMYLSLVSEEDIQITKNGRNIAMLTSPKEMPSWVDEISGIISSTDEDTKKIKAERLAQKHESLY